MAPRITIIIATLNSERTLARCLESIAAQSYRNLEVIVMDGGSTDRTPTILRRYQRMITYWESKLDTGIYNAWNKAVKHSRGDWIYFIGADDYLWEPTVLERMVRHLTNSAKGVHLLYGSVNTVSGDGKVIQTFGMKWGKIRSRFMQVMCIPHQGVFHHRSLFEKHGLFDESFRIAGDYEFLLRELKDGTALFIPGIIVAGVQYGGVSSDPKRTLLVLREILRARKYNRVKTFPFPSYWIWVFIKASIRSWLTLVFGRPTATCVANAYRRLTRRTSISD